jgi:hypothetical protein
MDFHHNKRARYDGPTPINPPMVKGSLPAIQHSPIGGRVLRNLTAKVRESEIGFHFPRPLNFLAPPSLYNRLLDGSTHEKWHTKTLNPAGIIGRKRPFSDTISINDEDARSSMNIMSRKRPISHTISSDETQNEDIRKRAKFMALVSRNPGRGTQMLHRTRKRELIPIQDLPNYFMNKSLEEDRDVNRYISQTVRETLDRIESKDQEDEAHFDIAEHTSKGGYAFTPYHGHGYADAHAQNTDEGPPVYTSNDYSQQAGRNKSSPNTKSQPSSEPSAYLATARRLAEMGYSTPKRYVPYFSDASMSDSFESLDGSLGEDEDMVG